MIQALLEYGRQQGLASTPGYGEADVKWFLDFDEAGERFVGVSPATADGKGVRTFRDIPRLSAEEKKGRLLLGRAADFLLAPLGEIFGLDDKGNDDEGKAKRAVFFRECLAEASEFMPVLGLLARTLALSETRERAIAEATARKAKWTDKATVRLGATFPVGEDDWKPWWDTFRLRLGKPPRADSGMMICFGTGDPVTPQDTHAKFKGLNAIGGTTFGEPLVTFDQEAFKSYGLKQGDNAAMGSVSVAAYARALTDLIEKSVLLAGSYYVAWYTGPRAVVKAIQEEEDDFITLLTRAPSKEDEAVDPIQANARLRAAMERVQTAQGDGGGIKKLRFAVLSFSVPPGRIMVRDYVQGSVLTLNDAADLWFDHLNVVDALGRPAKLPNLQQLIECPLTPGTSRGWTAPANAWAREMWRAAITVAPLPGRVVRFETGDETHTALFRATPIPRNAFDRVLDAHRRLVVSEGLQCMVSRKGELTTPARLTARRMALLKAYLLRSDKDITMTPGLDPDHPNAAYHCGRLVALYDDLQRAALGDVGAGVVQRFYAGAAVNPALVFPRLAKLATAHLDKLEGGLAFWYEGQLGSAHDGIKGAYPNALKSEEQALFALGFWHQIAERNRRLATGKPNKSGQTTEPTDAENP